MAGFGFQKLPIYPLQSEICNSGRDAALISTRKLLREVDNDSNVEAKHHRNIVVDCNIYSNHVRPASTISRLQTSVELWLKLREGGLPEAWLQNTVV